MQGPLGVSPFIFLSLNSFIEHEAEHKIINPSQYRAYASRHGLVKIRKLDKNEPNDSAKDNGTEKS